MSLCDWVCEDGDSLHALLTRHSTAAEGRVSVAARAAPTSAAGPLRVDKRPLSLSTSSDVFAALTAYIDERFARHEAFITAQLQAFASRRK